MSILDGIASFGEACRKVKLFQDYEITTGINGEGREKPYFTLHLQGNYSVKIVKLAASAVIAAGAVSIYKIVKYKKD